MFSEAQSVFPLFYFFKSLACISFLHMYPTTFFAQIFILLLCRWLSQSHQWSTIILAAVIIFLLTCPLPWSCILQLQDFFFFFLATPLHWLGFVRGCWMQKARLPVLHSEINSSYQEDPAGLLHPDLVFVLGVPLYFFSAVQLFCTDSRGVVCSNLNINSSW